jgi:hypothetical protein
METLTINIPPQIDTKIFDVQIYLAAKLYEDAIHRDIGPLWCICLWRIYNRFEFRYCQCIELLLQIPVF